MNPSAIEIIATTFFGLAIAHTFLSSWFLQIAHKYPEGSMRENLFHMLGEVEVVFGIWAALFLAAMALVAGGHEAVAYAERLNFTEPLFVFAIMGIAATKPVITIARTAIFSIARLLPLNREVAVYLSCLIVGPLLGSLITEPAAMTVTALILLKQYFQRKVTQKFRYITLGVLFVNVSIGGVLTSFAAPPVLMVASKWGWDNLFMLQTFGWKAVCAVLVNALFAVLVVRRELTGLVAAHEKQEEIRAPYWLIAVHICALAAVVLTAHHPVIFIGIFLLFLGFAAITNEYQSELLLKQSLLVAFFLAGLVVLGGFQRWWLEPVLSGMGNTVLFLGAAGLTAMTDNAALTYLGSLLPNITDDFKYALVAGAVTGGGLTVIANAPNPAGFSILQDSFGDDGISPLKLLAAAAVPTAISLAFFFVFWR